MENEENTPVEEQEEQPEQLAKKWEFKLGSTIIVLVAIAALVFIIWLIYSIWSQPSDEGEVEQPVVQQPVAEEPEYIDPTYVEDRDPEVLGLRIDTIIGRFFTQRETGQTLYSTDLACVGDCLDEWTPYLSDVAVVDGGDFGTMEREDTGELQYTWEGQGLYTYQLDSQDSVLGDGHSGTWHIARP